MVSPIVNSCIVYMCNAYNAYTLKTPRVVALPFIYGFEHIISNQNYSLFQKKRTFNSNFFLAPPPEGLGPKLDMVDYINESSTHAQFVSLKNLQPF